MKRAMAIAGGALVAAFLLAAAFDTCVGFIGFAKAQHNPQACAREEDQERPGHLVACKCYETKDPCQTGETVQCKAYCKKDACGCCQP